MDPAEFASRIDHTLLDKDHTLDDVVWQVRRARRVGANVCVPPTRVDDVADDFEGELMTVIGYPMGYHDAEVVVLEAEKAVDAGADSVDLATDVSALKSGDIDGYVRQIEAVVSAADSVKAILELGLLTEDEIETAAHLASEAGVEHLKTCTGFVGGGVTVDDVRVLADLDLDVGVKASGGVASAEEALALFEAGADLVGASRGVEIVEEYRGL